MSEYKALVDKGVLTSESARATAPRIHSHTRVAVAARAVPGKDGVAVRPVSWLHISMVC